MTLLKSLKTKKGRDESGLFVVEGAKFIAEIPETCGIRCYLATGEFAAAHDMAPFEKRARVEIVRSSVFAAIADTVSPQGIMAVCEKMPHTLAEILRPGVFVMLGENLQDPGNVGTLLRTAAAAGAAGAIFTHGSCDVYAPKVIRASAGAVLRLPIILPDEDIFAALKSRNFAIYAADPRGTALPYDINLRENFCILIGSESHGISDEARKNATALVRLPMPGKTESLNAAVAGSILMYEAVRQQLLFF